MPVTTANYQSILKIDYHGPIQDQLENTTPFLNRIERYTEETGGAGFYIPLRTGRTGSIGARNDNATETIPTGANPTYTQATYSPKSLYATMRLTGKSMRVSRANAYAFAKANVQDMADTLTDMKKDVNRQLFGDGSAELAMISSMTMSGGTTATFTVTNNHYATKPTKFIYVGQILDLASFQTPSTVATNATNITVTSVVNTQSFTATPSANVTISTASIYAVYRQGNIDSGTPATIDGNPKEIFGLIAGIDTGNPAAIRISGSATGTSSRTTAKFGLVDRTVAAGAFYQGQIEHNSGVLRPLSVNLLELGIEDSVLNAGGSPSLIQANFPIYRIYGVGLAAAKAAGMSEMDLDGGFKALDINGLPMVRDPESPDYTVFVIDESTWMLGITGPWEWVEDGSGNVLTRIPGYDQYEAVLVRDCQLMCKKPASNVKIVDVSHS